MEVKLIVVDGKSNRRQVKLKLPADIGRSRQAKLTIGHARVSRQHCQLVERNGFVVVKDLGSLNGTFVDGDRVTEAVIKPGERLTIGPLTFQVDYQAPEAAEVADDDEPLEAFLGQPAEAFPAEGSLDTPTDEAPAVAKRGGEPDFDFLADDEAQEPEAEDVPSFDDEDEAAPADADDFEFESAAPSAASDDDTWNSAAPVRDVEPVEDVRPVDDDDLFDLDDEELFDKEPASEEPVAQESADDDEPSGGSLWERALSGVETAPEADASPEEDVLPVEDVVPVDEDEFSADEDEGPAAQDLAEDDSAGSSETPAFEAPAEPAKRPRSGGRGGSDAVDFSFLMDDAADESESADEAQGDEPVASDEEDFFPGDVAAQDDAAPAAAGDFEQPIQDVAVEEVPLGDDLADDGAEDAVEDFFAPEEADEAPAVAAADAAADDFDFLNDEPVPAVAEAATQPEVAEQELEPGDEADHEFGVDDAFDDVVAQSLAGPAQDAPLEDEPEVAPAASGGPDFGFLADDADADAEQAAAPEQAIEPAAEEPVAEAPAVEEPAAQELALEEPVAEAPAPPAPKKGKPLKGQPLKGRPFQKPSAAQAAPAPAPIEPAAEAPSEEEPFFVNAGGTDGKADQADEVPQFAAAGEVPDDEEPADDFAAAFEESAVDDFLADEESLDEVPVDEAPAENDLADEAPTEAAELPELDAAPPTSAAAARKPAKKEKRSFWPFGRKKDKAKDTKAAKPDKAAKPTNGRADAPPFFEMPTEAADEPVSEEVASEATLSDADDDIGFEPVEEAGASNGVYHGEAESEVDEAFDMDEALDFEPDADEAVEEQPVAAAEAAAEDSPAASDQDDSDDDSPDDALSQFLKGFN